MKNEIIIVFFVLTLPAQTPTASRLRPNSFCFLVLAEREILRLHSLTLKWFE